MQIESVVGTLKSFKYTIAVFVLTIIGVIGLIIILTPKSGGDLKAAANKNEGVIAPDTSSVKDSIASTSLSQYKPLIRRTTDVDPIFEVRFGPKDVQYMKIPLQRWSHIVVNYFVDYDNVHKQAKEIRADLFLNGEIHRSATLSNVAQMPIFSKEIDKVTVGDKNGMSGAIKDVKYFSNTIDSSTIANMYNLGEDTIAKLNIGRNRVMNV